MATSHAPQPQQGNPEIEAGAFVGALLGGDVTESSSNVFRPSSVVREFVTAHRSRLTIEAIEHGELIGIPDGDSADWFVIRRCGHISSLYASRARAIASSCGICAELEAAERQAQCVLMRLQHARSLAKPTSSVSVNSLR